MSTDAAHTDHPEAVAGPATAPPATAPQSPAATLGAARRRLRLRAIVDGALLALAVAAVPFLFASTLDALVATLGAGGGAVVLYMARRGNDLERFAREVRARNAGLAERGIPLSAWHAGAPLPPWEERSFHSAS